MKKAEYVKVVKRSMNNNSSVKHKIIYMRVEPRHTFSIYLPTSLYQKVLDKAGKGKVITFIKQVLEEKLNKEEQQKKEEFQKKLIAGYKSTVANKELQKELAAWDELEEEDISNDE